MGVQQDILDAVESGAVATIQSYITHIAVGDDDTAIAVADTALYSEVLREEALTPIITTANTLTASLFLDVTEANGETIKEIGVFNANSGGTMVSRNLTIPKEKTANKEFFYDNKYTIRAENG